MVTLNGFHWVTNKASFYGQQGRQNKMGRAAALPYQIAGRAALPRRPNFNPLTNESDARAQSKGLKD